MKTTNDLEMIKRNSYFALNVYCSAVEFIYFVHNLIESQGPKYLSDIEKHVKFYKPDLSNFIAIFDGEDFNDKLGNMLCALSLFYKKEKKLHLLNNHSNIKEFLLWDLIISKVYDMILRGIDHMKDMCNLLNLNSLIEFKEQHLIAFVKNCHFFYVTGTVVRILQFHGILGFDHHLYERIVQYFQSYLQCAKSLSFKEVKVHSKFIPACTALNLLVILSVLFTSPVFKCKSGQVNLRRKLKPRENYYKLLDINVLSTKTSLNSMSVALLVNKAFGTNLKQWCGEISYLSKCMGYIQCVVNFTDGYQGIFVVYFSQSALKWVTDVKDLQATLNIRDNVELDAVFSEKEIAPGVFWQATYVRITKQYLRKSTIQLEVDTEKYFESICFITHDLKIASQICSNHICNTSFTMLEKENERGCTLHRKYIPHKDSSMKSKNTNYYDNQFNEQSKRFNLNISQQFQNCKKSLSNELCDLLWDHRLKIRSPESSNNVNKSIYYRKFASEKKIKACQLVKPQSVISYDDEEYLQKNTYEENIKKQQIIPNLLILHSAFMFAEVVTISEKDGVAISIETEKKYEIFFRIEALTKLGNHVLKEGCSVFTFIPYFNTEESLLIATLVDVLADEEATKIKASKIEARSYLTETFIPQFNKNLSNTYPYCSDFSMHIFRKTSSQNFKTYTQTLDLYLNFVLSLSEICNFDHRSLVNLIAFVNMLYFLDRKITYSELIKWFFNMLLEIPSVFYSNQFPMFKSSSKKGIKICKTYTTKTLGLHSGSSNFVKKLDYFTLLSHENSSLTNSIKNFEHSVNSNDSFKTNNNNALVASDIFNGNDSCSSLSSYKSCNSSISEEDTFISCSPLSACLENSERYSGTEHLLRFHENANIFQVNNALQKFKTKENSNARMQKYLSVKKKRLNTVKFKFSTKLFKAKKSKKKSKFSLLLENAMFHVETKSCVTTAVVSAITNSCVLFSVKFNQKTVSLVFPMCLIPENIQKKLKVNSALKIAVIPFAVINFAHVLYADFSVLK